MTDMVKEDYEQRKRFEQSLAIALEINHVLSGDVITGLQHELLQRLNDQLLELAQTEFERAQESLGLVPVFRR